MLLTLLLALLGNAWAAEKVTYYYTNEQGTPLATTDENGVVLTTVDYRAYGVQALGTPQQGPGYTGHVNDADTSLVYMQQRYYDPNVGRFLSVDPVPVNGNTGDSFNRYKYAANNPYSFKDPDGRQDCRSCEISYGASVGYMLRDQPEAMRVWMVGENAAGTAGNGAEQGAALGQAIGKFVDTGDFSGPAVATVAAKAAITLITHGKVTGHYTNTHQSGTKYHGKGGEARMLLSASEKKSKGEWRSRSQNRTHSY